MTNRTQKKKIIAVLFGVSVFVFAIFGLHGLNRLVNRTFFATQSILAQTKDTGNKVLINIPFHRQEHALSCEAATLVMVLNYYGLNVNETELIKNLPFTTTAPRDSNNIWGDPDVGFVGKIDGSFPDTGYGVHEKPIAELANKYRQAKVMENATLEDILTEITLGRPVIIWGVVGSGEDISWFTPEGKKVKAIYGEHTRVVVGFSGTVSNPSYIHMIDPIYGKITMSKNRFLNNWKLLDNKAVLVY